MKYIIIGNCHLKTNKEQFTKFINNVYERFYKKEKIRHISRQDKRLPKIKVTEDIFSLSIFFKDKTKRELRLFIDGKIFLNEMTITSISLEGEEFNNHEYQAIVDLLKEISMTTDGYILVSLNDHAGRLKNGVLDNSKVLLKEIYDIPKEERTEEIKQTYEWLMESEEEF